MKYSIVLAITLMLSMTACEQVEIPVIVDLPEGVESVQLSMGEDYTTQLFFDLGSGAVIATNNKTAWDLGFESAADGWRVWLNSANGGAVAATGITDFGFVTNTDGWEYKYDLQNGNPDSTAFGDHRGTGQVYVVNRGFATDASSLGFFKIIVEEAAESAYTIRAAALDGSNEHTLIIPKDESVNLMTYSFEQQSLVSIEPPKGNWDLLFSQYTFLFIDPPTPYIVTGVLSNRYNVEVAIDTLNAFEDITTSIADQLTFTTDLDAIGYEWKYFDFAASEFLVDPDMNFIIRDTEGVLYKLHFIDFYDENGTKGAPSFEWQIL
jgi:hypothetical protein